MKTGVGWIDEFQDRPARTSKDVPVWPFCYIDEPHDSHTVNEGYALCGGIEGNIAPRSLEKISEMLSRAQQEHERAEKDLARAIQRKRSAERDVFEMNVLWHIANHREKNN